jgi:excisionase family DNA binding protein
MVTVSITEAAQRLGVSEKTVRRRLSGGTLRGERVTRPQGYTWAVHLDEGLRPVSVANGHGTERYRRWMSEAPKLRRIATRPVTYAVVGLSVLTLLRRAARRKA